MSVRGRARRAGRRRLAVPASVLVLVLVAGSAGCGSDDDGGGRAAGPEQGLTTEPGSTGSTGSTSPGSPSSATPSSGPGLDSVAVTAAEVARVDSPTVLTARPGTTDLYLAEREGRVRVLEVGDAGAVELRDGAVLDISDAVSVDAERGLLGLAFSADGATLYVSYTNLDGDSRVVEYAMDGDEVDAGSRRLLLAVPQPYPNHNGGDIHLGPDGFLYVGLGDGGSADDPEDRARDLDEVLGKILRIDPRTPSGDEPYAIPDGNPYRDGGGRPEIFLSGVRNPWRFSFDADTGDLWIGDVGQNAVEEVDWLPAGTGAGTDLGWSGMEGTRVNIDDRLEPDTVAPVYEYLHEDGGCSITGGTVYRGSAIDGLAGAYVFGDYCDGKLRALTIDADGQQTAFRELGLEVPQLVSINPGADGELYLLTLDGTVSRLAPA